MASAKKQLKEHVNAITEKALRKQGKRFVNLGKKNELDLEALADTMKKDGLNSQELAGEMFKQYYEKIGEPSSVYATREEADAHARDKMSNEDYDTVLNHINSGDLGEAYTHMKKAHENKNKLGVKSTKLAHIAAMDQDEKLKIAEVILKDHQDEFEGVDKQHALYHIAEKLPNYIMVKANQLDERKQLGPRESKNNLSKKIKELLTEGQEKPYKKAA